MARNKNEEVTIDATYRDSDTVTDLEVKIDDEVIGTIHRGEEDRQYQVSYGEDQKATATSIDNAVQAIISDYNLHR